MNRSVLVTATVLATALALSACSSPADGNAEPVPATPGDPAGDPITVRITGDPVSIDPQTTNQAVGREVSFYFYDTLLNLSDGEIVSGLATDWEQVSPTTYEFTLSEGVTCADGAALTASDVKANFDRIADPDTNTPFAPVFLGAKAIAATADDETSSLVLKLPSANSDFLAGLTTYPGIICPAGLADPDSLATEPQGTGPYTLVESVANDHYTLEPRLDYTWGPGGDFDWDVRSPKQLVLQNVGDDSTAANMYLSGQLDVTSATGSNRERLTQQSDTAQAASRAVVSLYFNQRPGALTADEDIRRALAQAIDREGLASAAQEGYGTLAPSMILDTAMCFDAGLEDFLPAYDPEAAREVLEGADVNIELLVSGNGASDEKQAADFIASAWTEAGVDVTVSSPDGSTVVETLFTGGSWDVSLLAQLGVAVPSLLVPYNTGPATPDGTNFSGMQNVDYATGSAAAMAEEAGTACATWGTAEQALHEQVNQLPLYYDGVEFFGRGVTFEAGLYTGSSFVPTSFRWIE